MGFLHLCVRWPHPDDNEAQILSGRAQRTRHLAHIHLSATLNARPVVYEVNYAKPERPTGITSVGVMTYLTSASRCSGRPLLAPCPWNICP